MQSWDVVGTIEVFSGPDMPMKQPRQLWEILEAPGGAFSAGVPNEPKIADFRIIQDIVKKLVKRGAISKIREVRFFSIPIRYPKQ